MPLPSCRSSVVTGRRAGCLGCATPRRAGRRRGERGRGIRLACRCSNVPPAGPSCCSPCARPRHAPPPPRRLAPAQPACAAAQDASVARLVARTRPKRAGTHGRCIALAFAAADGGLFSEDEDDAADVASPTKARVCACVRVCARALYACPSCTPRTRNAPLPTPLCLACARARARACVCARLRRARNFRAPVRAVCWQLALRQAGPSGPYGPLRVCWAGGQGPLRCVVSVRVAWPGPVRLLPGPLARPPGGVLGQRAGKVPATCWQGADGVLTRPDARAVTLPCNATPGHVREPRQEAALARLPPRTPRDPFNFTPMAANPISSGPPHVRCTPMGRTCGGPDEIKKNTHPKNITALFRAQAPNPWSKWCGNP